MQKPAFEHGSPTLAARRRREYGKDITIDRTYKRSAFALRVLAALQLFFVARKFAHAAVENSLIAALDETPQGDQEAIWAKFRFYGQISYWIYIGTLLLIVAATVVLALSFRKGRSWALAAGGLLLAEVALSIFSQFITIPSEVPFWLRSLWWAGDLSMGVGLALPLLAVAREAPSRLARLGVIGAVCLLVIKLGIATFTFLNSNPLTVVTWLTRGSAVLSAAWFAGVAFPLAGRLARTQAGDATAAVALGSDGTPLRALGWALLARIASGITLQVLLMVSLANRNHASAGALTTMGAGASLLISIIMLVAMARYRGFPPIYRGNALIIAMGLVLLGTGADIYTAYAGNKLFGMIAEAKRSSSFWGMPNLSEMETLQARLTWVGRGAVVLGIGAGLALLASLKATAQALGAIEHVNRANRAYVLLFSTGAGAVLTSFLLPAISGDFAPIVLALSVGVLALAIMLLVDWLKMFFGLAAEMERVPIPLAPGPSTSAHPPRE